MYEEKFSNFGNMLNISNFEEVCLEEYDPYLDTVIEFKETNDNLALIYEKYKDDIIAMILNNDQLKDFIMTDSNKLVRHDKPIEKEIDITKITDNIFEKNESLNHFEGRAKNIILLEIAKLINCYGVEELVSNYDSISKEIKLGVFEAKTSRYTSESQLEQAKKRLEIAENFGEESIPYVENYSLLQERIEALRKFSKDSKEQEELDILVDQIVNVDEMIENKDGDMLKSLQAIYEGYEKINREMLVSRIKDKELMLLHFVPNFDNEGDVKQDEFFQQELNEYIKTSIEKKYGRPYNEETDAKEADEITAQYVLSRQNPFNLQARIPLKNRYTNPTFTDVITAPHTKMSCSICKSDEVTSHLDRKIAMGFEIVPSSAIKTINKGYNSELDRFSFLKILCLFLKY